MMAQTQELLLPKLPEKEHEEEVQGDYGLVQELVP